MRYDVSFHEKDPRHETEATSTDLQEIKELESNCRFLETLCHICTNEEKKWLQEKITETIKKTPVHDHAKAIEVLVCNIEQIEEREGLNTDFLYLLAAHCQFISLSPIPKTASDSSQASQPDLVVPSDNPPDEKAVALKKHLTEDKKTALTSNLSVLVTSLLNMCSSELSNMGITQECIKKYLKEQPVMASLKKTVARDDKSTPACNQPVIVTIKKKNGPKVTVDETELKKLIRACEKLARSLTKMSSTAEEEDAKETIKHLLITFTDITSKLRDPKTAPAKNKKGNTALLGDALLTALHSFQKHAQELYNSLIKAAKDTLNLSSQASSASSETSSMHSSFSGTPENSHSEQEEDAEGAPAIQRTSVSPLVLARGVPLVGSQSAPVSPPVLARGVPLVGSQSAPVSPPPSAAKGMPTPPAPGSRLATIVVPPLLLSENAAQQQPPMSQQAPAAGAQVPPPPPMPQQAPAVGAQVPPPAHQAAAVLAVGALVRSEAAPSPSRTGLLDQIRQGYKLKSSAAQKNTGTIPTGASQDPLQDALRRKLCDIRTANVRDTENDASSWSSQSSSNPSTPTASPRDLNLPHNKTPTPTASPTGQNPPHGLGGGGGEGRKRPVQRGTTGQKLQIPLQEPAPPTSKASFFHAHRRQPEPPVSSNGSPAPAAPEKPQPPPVSSNGSPAPAAPKKPQPPVPGNGSPAPKKPQPPAPGKDNPAPGNGSPAPAAAPKHR